MLNKCSGLQRRGCERRAGVRLAFNECVERLVNRLLPYWSIGINVLLILWMLTDTASHDVVRHSNYAALIDYLSDAIAFR